MSTDEKLLELLQDTFIAEERCLAGKPCGSAECAACIYEGRVQE